jgi:hypothetical protein
MDVIFVEDPLAIQNAQPNIPTSMKEICKKQNIPLKGNAAGNYPDFLNLTGEVDIAPMECGCVLSSSKIRTTISRWNADNHLELRILHVWVNHERESEFGMVAFEEIA